METTDVLIAGAGPAGLTLAVELARRGVGVRLVDRAGDRRIGTGCPTVWPRTLDVLQSQGLDAGKLRAAGVELRRKVFTVLGETHHLDLTPPPGRPRGLSIPQADLERALTERLTALGGEVRRGVAVLATHREPDGVVAELSGPGSRWRIRASWFVRATGPEPAGEAEQRTFPGLRWARADVTVSAGHELGPGNEHIVRTRSGHAGLVPLPGGRHRLFVALPAGRPPTAASVREVAREVGGWTVTELDARSLWWQQPMSRLAGRFRDGRELWAGEAAVRYPAPVMGFNGAVHDAFNLGWKLAAVLRGEAGEDLLDTYAQERRTVAVELLRRAERIVGFGSADPGLLLDRLRAGVFEARDEPIIRYGPGRLTAEPISGGAEPAPGCAVPVVGAPAPASGAGWVAAVPAGLETPVRAAVAGLGEAAVCPAAGDDLVLIRPDGHVGWRGTAHDLPHLSAYVRGVLA